VQANGRSYRLVAATADISCCELLISSSVVLRGHLSHHRRCMCSTWRSQFVADVDRQTNSLSINRVLGTLCVFRVEFSIVG
jgi:hypothetical protein